MKTIILAMAISAIFTMAVNAQNNSQISKNGIVPDTGKVKSKLKFNLGLEEGIPVGYVSRYSSFVTGGSVQGAYTIVRDLDITLNAGYLYFLAKNGEKGLSFVPVMAGLKFSFLPKFYLSGQLGASAYVGNESDKELYLTYAQGIGYKVSKYIDVLAKYEGINTAVERNYSFAGLRIAYTFSGSK